MTNRAADPQLDERVRRAADRFDEARQAEADRLISWIASEPGTHAQALRSSPEGAERMLRAWRAIRADLHAASEERWTFTHQQLAENLMGRRVEEPAAKDKPKLVATKPGPGIDDFPESPRGPKALGAARASRVAGISRS